MNQVPWRRILERVEDTEAEENRASVINLQDRMPQRGREHHRPNPEPARGRDLESELEFALDQVQREERMKPRARAPQPRREAPPAYIPENDAGRSRAPQSRSSIPMRRPDLVTPPVAPPVQARQAKGGNGAKNLLAISLSAAIVGFAFYQISNQWSDSSEEQGAPKGPADIAASLPAFQAASTAGSEPQRSGAIPADRSAATSFEGNRIDLRPSLAPEQTVTGNAAASASNVVEPSQPTRQAALDNDIQQAARLFNSDRANEPGSSRTNTASIIDSGANEQSMLQRGHSLLEQGHLSGARLIFEHLAEKNSALGAFALAQSYDPNYLASHSIQDSTASAAMAAQWYQKAAELTEGN